MHAPHLLRLVTLGALALAMAGCSTIREHSLTGNLWSSRSFTEIRTVSTDEPINLFHSAQANDFLLIYNEVSDEDAKSRRRAYYLRRNAEATARGKKPDFFDADLGELVPIPLNGAAAGTELPRAKLDRTELTVTTLQGDERFTLASYPSGRSIALQTALTPLAVVGDATIGALIVGFFGAVLIAQSGASFEIH